MKKNSITSKISPCCSLPFSVMYWYLKNLTLNSEADREFLISKLSQSGNLTKEAWLVLINSGSLETDSAMTKVQFLKIFDCKSSPDCNELKILIEGFKIGNYDPNDEKGIGWTEITTFENYDGKVIQKVIGYEGGVGNLPSELSDRIGKYFSENNLTTNKDIATDFKIQILNGSISANKTDFAKSIKLFNKQRFDKNTMVSGIYINEVYGNETANISYNATDFIQVNDLQGNFISATQLNHGAFYDEDKIFLEGFSISESKVLVPENAFFFRTSMFSGNENYFQVEEGISLSNYEDFTPPKNGIMIENLALPKTIQEEEVFFANPSLIYVVENRQIDFIFESFMIPKIGRKLSEYYVSAFGYRGKFLENRTRLTPYDDSDFLLKIERYPNVTKQKYIAIKTAPIANGTGQTRKILVIGDSTVNSGYLIKAINDYFEADAMDINLIGTRNTGGLMHEGRSGWTFDNYFTQSSISGVANPFFNGTTFNFSNYLSTTSQTMSAGDWVFIQLGINDLYSIAGNFLGGDVDSKILQMQTQLQEIISQIHAVNSSIRIGIVMTTPPAISQDATANLLQSAFYSSEYYLKKGLIKWWDKLLNLFDNEVSRNSRVYLIPCNIVLDRVNNFQTAEQDIDVFNTDKIIVQIDDVHPKESGYKNMASVYIGAIKQFG